MRHIDRQNIKTAKQARKHLREGGIIKVRYVSKRINSIPSVTYFKTVDGAKYWSRSVFAEHKHWMRTYKSLQAIMTGTEIDMKELYNVDNYGDYVK